MNFRTTMILLVLLGAMFIVVMFTRDHTDAPVDNTVARLFDISEADVQKLSITSDDGKTMTLSRSGVNWRLESPVKSPAEESAVSGLLSQIVLLQSVGQVDVSGTAGASVGLDKPSYKIELTASGGKTVKFDVGSPSATGDKVYIKREGQSRGDVVAASILSQLEKPVGEYRRHRLIDLSPGAVRKVSIATTQQTISLEKTGEKWAMTHPLQIPADGSAVSEIAIGFSNLRAEKFIEPAGTPAQYGLDHPVMTVSLASAPPSTPPSTQPTSAPSELATTTLKIGGFDDVMKQNVYAMITPGDTIVTMPAAALQMFRKEPRDLRDKEIVNLDPAKVTKLTISTHKPATTQPTSRPAVDETVVLERHASPTTAPTTAPTSAPSEPPVTWVIASQDNAPADEAKIDRILAALHPLKATRFVEPPSIMKPTDAYVLKVESSERSFEMRLTDDSSTSQLVAVHEDLAFDLARTLLTDLQNGFARPAPGSAAPAGFPGGGPVIEPPFGP